MTSHYSEGLAGWFSPDLTSTQCAVSSHVESGWGAYSQNGKIDFTC